MSPLLIAGTAIFYLLILFALAYTVDRQPGHGVRAVNSSFVYTLSLAIYCTSWTYYGSVGLASKSGIAFLPIYLGPTLAFSLGWFLLRKILRVAKANRITSIASFLSSRYGKSTGLGALVTVVAVIGTVPYLALQLKAVSTSFSLLTQDPALQSMSANAPILGDAGLWAAVLLTAFAMLFGSRSIQPGEHHHGMVAAIALDSIVKLLCLLAVGLAVGYGMFEGFGDLFRQAGAEPELAPLFRLGDAAAQVNWVALTALSFMVVLCLPRQFQVAVVENIDERHLDRAMWLFPLYLLAINLFVLPLALAGRLLLPPDADPDSIVLLLPLSAGWSFLAIAVFIGGLSASAGMIIVSTTALSTMTCNDLVMPALLRFRQQQLAARRDLIPLLLSIRRLAMAAVMGLGFIYMRYTGADSPLVSIGLVSFVAVVQFFPALALGLFWRRATRIGALAGIGLGFAVWAYTLFIPSIAKSALLPASFIAYGPFGIAMLKPYALFGLRGLDPASHSLFWSLLVNVGVLVGLSLVLRQTPIERAQAALFVDAFGGAEAAQLWRRTAALPDLRTLVGRYLGHPQAEAALDDHARRRGLDPGGDEADAGMVLHAERLLAGAIGSASARVLVASVVHEEPPGMHEVMRLLDETSRLIEANRQLEIAGQQLHQANERLQELDRLKDDFVSTVNHELRTPLTSIRSFSEILRDNPELDAENRTMFYDIIIRETERLTRLINQMLDLAQIQSGQIAAVVTPVNLTEVVAEAIAATDQLMREKGIAIRVVARAPRAIVRADRDLLMQIILNLLSNAAKFCPAEEGRVTIAFGPDGAGWAEFMVTDNGPGIAPELREAVFDRFRQVSDAATGKPTGSGLGLTICRSIVTRLGGTIRIDDAIDGGAQFRVRLPTAVMSQPVAGVAP